MFIAEQATPTSGQASTTEQPPTSGQEASIIGFAAVLVILVAAIVIILFLCICYGLCKLHSRPPVSRNVNSRPPSMIPLPSPRTVQPKSPAKNLKSPSFQNSPDFYAMTHPPNSTSDVAVINLAQLPVNISRKTTAQYTTVDSKNRPQHSAPLSPLQFQTLYVDGPTEGYQRSATPKSALCEKNKKLPPLLSNTTITSHSKIQRSHSTEV